MTYLVFFGEPPSETVCDSIGSAIAMACGLIQSGAIVWGIRGSHGFIMERSDIELEYQRRVDEWDRLERKVDGLLEPAARPFPRIGVGPQKLIGDMRKD